MESYYYIVPDKMTEANSVLKCNWIWKYTNFPTMIRNEETGVVGHLWRAIYTTSKNITISQNYISRATTHGVALRWTSNNPFPGWTKRSNTALNRLPATRSSFLHWAFVRLFSPHIARNARMEVSHLTGTHGQFLCAKKKRGEKMHWMGVFS